MFILHIDKQTLQKNENKMTEKNVILSFIA